jgi:hypothetical protein
VIIIGSLLITFALGAFISQQEQTQGNEGFAPDAPEWTASLTIGEKFASNSETPMQVLFEADSGDVLTADGLSAYAAATEAVTGRTARSRGSLARCYRVCRRRASRWMRWPTMLR